MFVTMQHSLSHGLTKFTMGEHGLTILRRFPTVFYDKLWLSISIMEGYSSLSLTILTMVGYVEHENGHGFKGFL